MYVLLVFKGLRYGFAGKSMVESKNLKLKLGLCGLALTSFLAINAHSTVHADTVQDNNANQNAITWDSDQDDSQVVKEDSNQSQPTQNVQPQAPAVQKKQVAQAAQSKQSAVQSAPVQNKAVQPVQKQTTVQPKQWQVAVSNVSSTVSTPNRAERSAVRQSSVQTSIVNHLNANTARNNQVNANVKVSNVNSDAQMPVQTQVIAKLSNKAKTYVISIPTPSQAGMPMTYDGASSMMTENSDFAANATFIDGCWIYNGKIYTSTNELDKAGILDNPSACARVATVNPEFMMNGTQFLTDMGVNYNNHRLGLLVIPKFTRLDSDRYYNTTDPNDYSGGTDFDDIRTENSGYLTTNFIGLLPTQVPAGHVRWTDSSMTSMGLDDLAPHIEYSYTVVPIDMNTGDVIQGVSIDGTATKPTNLHSFINVNTKFAQAPDHFKSYEQVKITGATVSADQNLVSPFIKTMLTNINNGVIKPYNYSGYASGSNFMDYGRPSGDYSSKSNMFNHFNYNDESNLYDENNKPTTLYQFEDNVAIPYAENLLYAAVKTREVNPDSPNAKKQAKRIIHLNFPNGVRPDSYNNIVDKDNNVVQTVTFTRSGTENLADGSVQWGPWQGDGKFAPVTLPGIPGYTMVTTN